MLSYREALNIIAPAALPSVAETVALDEALGRVAIRDIACPSEVPPFANSAMDGFALRSRDTTDASNDRPVKLSVTRILTAGEVAETIELGDNCAVEIMTGATVPPGCDSVVPLERVEVRTAPDGSPQDILLSEPVRADSNLRKAGEDFLIGDSLLTQGCRINANQIMGLAAAGVNEVSVTQRPAIAVITTGNELASENSDELASGMIHDANGPYLDAAIKSLHISHAGRHRSGDVPDQLETLVRKLGKSAEIILTTGGVSAGRMDFVPQVLEQLGAKILFHKVSIRPGKPLLFARIPDGPLVFGLPGNPIAVAVGLRFFVVPALLEMQGLPAEEFPYAKLTNSLRKKPDMAFFAKAHADRETDGSLNVTVLPGQESFKINPLMRANCWAIADNDSDELAAGTAIKVAPLFPGSAL